MGSRGDVETTTILYMWGGLANARALASGPVGGSLSFICLQQGAPCPSHCVGFEVSRGRARVECHREGQTRTSLDGYFDKGGDSCVNCIQS